jgi:hypothetical protein
MSNAFLRVANFLEEMDGPLADLEQLELDLRADERSLVLYKLTQMKCGASFNLGSAMYGGPGEQFCTLNRGHVGGHHDSSEPIPVTIERLQEVLSG